MQNFMVYIVTLSTADNVKLIKQLDNGSVYCKKYKMK